MSTGISLCTATIIVFIIVIGVCCSDFSFGNIEKFSKNQNIDDKIKEEENNLRIRGGKEFDEIWNDPTNDNLNQAFAGIYLNRKDRYPYLPLRPELGDDILPINMMGVSTDVGTSAVLVKSHLKHPPYEDAFPDKIQYYNEVPCNWQYSKRYMYQMTPPARNSSHDIRNLPSWTPPTNKDGIGIFSHTDLFGNYKNQRNCPNFNKAFKTHSLCEGNRENQPTRFQKDIKMDKTDEKRVII